MEEFRTSATPRTMIGEIPVFCSFDEAVDIGKVVPNPKNPNHHPKAQIELLAKIIKAQGWRQPITVSTRSGLVVKGHGRLQAAILLGADKVPVDFQNYGTEAEEIADLTADNRLAELAEMNNTMLVDILSDFDTGEMPLELTGYTEEDMEGILAAIAGIEEAAFYIWHASSTRRDFEDAMTAAGLMENQYIIWVKNGIALGRSDYQWAHEPCFYASRAGITPKFYGDRAQHTVWRVTTRQEGTMMTVLGGGIVLTDGTGGKLYITDKPPKGKKVRYARMEAGNPIDLFQEDRMQTVWEVSRETNTLHPTQKPVEIPIRAIENSSKPGEIVLDFFGGSGSTLLGAEQTGRRCFKTELDPVYCDVIISRYVLHTGNVGVVCVRDGEEIPYIQMVREWAKANGREAEVDAMKIPVVVIKKITARNEEEEG